MNDCRAQIRVAPPAASRALVGDAVDRRHPPNAAITALSAELIMMQSHSMSSGK